MKEKPILFSAAMVRAILDGRKTQTRRIIKNIEQWTIEKQSEDLYTFPDKNGDYHNVSIACPHGKIGDRLWVRETFAKMYGGMNADENDFYYVYRADNEHPVKWKPSIFMPRSASRIDLEIANIRVERLNDISEEDAIAEGLNIFNEDDMNLYYSATSSIDEWDDGWFLNPIEAFKELWEKINSKGSWDKNPFVWVIEFKVVEDMKR